MEKILTGHDNKGEPIYYDPTPRVIPLGGGRYAFKWKGSKGQEETDIYARPDAIDVVVEAASEKAQDGRYKYTYKVRVLKTSPRDLSGVGVQTFSETAEAPAISGTLISHGTGHAKEFSVGRWFWFGLISDQRRVMPGQDIQLVIYADDLPGVVECRANASIVRETSSGEMPPELTDLLLRHDAWPHGLTIGPDERLAKMGLQGRLTYLIIRLPQMLELGWIENEEVMEWYKENILAGKTAEVRARAKADFDKKLITSEVLAMMTYLTK